MRYFYISEESRSHKHQRCSISTHSKCVGISFRLKFYLYSDVLSIRGTQTEHNGNLNKYCCTICGKSINAIHIYEENGAYGKAAAEGSIYNTTALWSSTVSEWASNRSKASAVVCQCRCVFSVFACMFRLSVRFFSMESTRNNTSACNNGVY